MCPGDPAAQLASGVLRGTAGSSWKAGSPLPPAAGQACPWGPECHSSWRARCCQTHPRLDSREVGGRCSRGCGGAGTGETPRSSVHLHQQRGEADPPGDWGSERPPPPMSLWPGRGTGRAVGPQGACGLGAGTGRVVGPQGACGLGVGTGRAVGPQGACGLGVGTGSPVGSQGVCGPVLCCSWKTGLAERPTAGKVPCV